MFIKTYILFYLYNSIQILNVFIIYSSFALDNIQFYYKIFIEYSTSVLVSLTIHSNNYNSE